MREVVKTLPSGRGDRLGVLVEHALMKFDEELLKLDAEHVKAKRARMSKSLRDDLLVSISKKYERLRPQLGIIHQSLATYQNCVDNNDVPVGLQHLIDVLMSDLTGPEGGDPMVCLDSVEMYSTVDLVSEFGELKKKHDGGLDIPAGYTDKRPIALNLPALDPANALLAPLLAHEVAHTAVEQTLLADLTARTSSATALVNEELETIRNTIGKAAAMQVGVTYEQWCGELLCDGVAIAVTGPSFLFAFSGYVPVSNYNGQTDHPHNRDRIAFHLLMLDRLGWTTLLRARVPKVYQWLVDASKSLPADASDEELLLRAATQRVHGEIIDACLAHVTAPLDPATMTPLLPEAVANLKEGIPRVEAGTEILSPWQVVGAGWLAALEARGDVPGTLVDAVGDAKFNAVLVKTLEMSSIVKAWRTHERPGL